MKIFLTIITYIFHPMLMPFYSIVLLLNFDVFKYSSANYYSATILSTLLFTLILPMIPIFGLKQKGIIKSYLIPNKKERTIPYTFAIITYALWLVFLYENLNFPIEFVLVASGSVLSVVGITLINLKWKISAHSAGVGGLLGWILSISYICSINPIEIISGAILVSGLVAISRIYLKAHTPLQVVFGFLLGIICCTTPVYFFEIFNDWLQTQILFH